MSRAALLAVLALAACGAPAGQEEFNPGGGAKAVPAAGPSASGAGTGSGAPPSASASGEKKVAGPGTETITVAPGLRVVIEWPAERDARMQAFMDDYVGQWRAVGTNGRDNSYLKGVVEPGNEDALRWVQRFLSRKQSARGTTKAYALKIFSEVGQSAEIRACLDESGIRVTDASGKPLAQQPKWTKPPLSTGLQAAAVRRGDDGVWRVKAYRHALYPHPLAKECTR